MEGSVNCSICFEPYDDSERAPMSLQCGHTLCQACLNRFSSNFKCPLDKKLLYKSQAKKNYELISEIEKAQAIVQEVQEKQQMMQLNQEEQNRIQREQDVQLRLIQARLQQQQIEQQQLQSEMAWFSESNQIQLDLETMVNRECRRIKQLASKIRSKKVKLSNPQKTEIAMKYYQFLIPILSKPRFLSEPRDTNQVYWAYQILQGVYSKFPQDVSQLIETQFLTNQDIVHIQLNGVDFRIVMSNFLMHNDIDMEIKVKRVSTLPYGQWFVIWNNEKQRFSDINIEILEDNWHEGANECQIVQENNPMPVDLISQRCIYQDKDWPVLRI